MSSYGKNEAITILAIGVLLTIASFLVGWWPLALLIIAATVALLSFFRDPERRVPTQRNVVVAPADGVVSSIHQLDRFEPFDGPATCIRIFLSVLNVHVNRSPCHGQVSQVLHKPGEHLNALNPDSAEANESNLIVLLHPIRQHPVAAVRQVAGLLARTIACGVQEGDILQRGQRIGMIKLGSTTELYLPHDLQPQVVVQEGQKVQGGLTVLAHVINKENASQRVTTVVQASQPTPSPPADPEPDVATESPAEAEPEAEADGAADGAADAEASDDSTPSGETETEDASTSRAEAARGEL